MQSPPISESTQTGAQAQKQEVRISANFANLKPPDPKPRDPSTGIYFIKDWGGHCGRGFVSNSRFSSVDPVIKRTNRSTSRKWRSLNTKGEKP